MPVGAKEGVVAKHSYLNETIKLGSPPGIPLFP